MTQMRRFPGPPDKLGESPRWNPDTGRIEWIDILGETESSSRPDGSDLVRKALSGEPAGFAYRTSGGRIMSLHHTLALRDENGKTQNIPVPDFDVESEWFNDCACDSRGRFWVGSLASDFHSKVGALYRVDPDLSTRQMDRGFVIGNGIGWSPDETVLYFCDSRQGIFAYQYDIETGSIGPRRMFISFAESDGHPDGLAIDVEGCIWAAMPSGGQILRLKPDGSIAQRVTTPTLWPTSLAFGGCDLGTLFVTTMRPLDGTAEGPHDGVVFAFEPGVSGAPMHRFGG